MKTKIKKLLNKHKDLFIGIYLFVLSYKYLYANYYNKNGFEGSFILYFIGGGVFLMGVYIIVRYFAKSKSSEKSN